MCTEYYLNSSLKKLDEILRIRLINKSDEQEWDKKISVGGTGLLIETQNEKPTLVANKWPAPPPLPNARMSDVEHSKGDTLVKRVYEKKTWEEGFTNGHVIVPMTSFVEGAYWGPQDGNAVRFSCEKDEVLFCAAIRFTSSKVSKEKLNAYSLLTHVASKQMLEYHHRLIILLKPKDALEWIQRKGEKPLEDFQFIMDNRYVPKFDVSIARKLSTYSEAKASTHRQSLEKEIEYRKVLETEGIAG